MKCELKSVRIFLLFFFSLASSVQALTLSEAVSTSENNSIELKRLSLQAESVRWQKVKAWSEFSPTLSLDGRHIFDERFESVPFNGVDVVIPANYTSLGINANWNIFSGFKDYNELRAAQFETDAYAQHFKFAKDRNRTLIRTLYYKALGSQILVEVADQNIEALENHLHDVTSRIRSGVSTRYDSLRVEVQLEDAKTEKAAATSSVAVSRARLFEAIGIVDDQKPLNEAMSEDFLKTDLGQINLENASHSDREALSSESLSAQAKALAAQSHWYPKISLFANYDWYNNYNHSITADDEVFKSAYMVGLNLKWDLFDGGGQYALQRQAAVASQLAELNLSRYDENLPVSLEEAKSRFNYNLLNYKAKLSSVKKAEEAVRLAKGGISAGILKNTDVLDAVVDLNRAKASAVKSQIEAIEALGQLELIVGHTL